MEKKILIIMFGAPGSGKGLLGDKIMEQMRLTKISTGDILRREVKDQTSLGCKIASRVKTGILVNDAIVNPIVKKALDEAAGGVLLDGYPRCFSQFEFLKQCVKDIYDPVCVYLNTPIEDILSRISQRRICENCGTTHFASQGCCPKCSGRSIVREDDALIHNRIFDYLETTEPVLREKIIFWCKVISVNGINIEKGLSDVLAYLKHF